MADSDVETKQEALRTLTAQSLLSAPLRDAIKTVVDDIPTGKWFAHTDAQEGSSIAYELKLKIGNEQGIHDFWAKNDLGLLRTVDHIASDNKGIIPDDIKLALKDLARAGGMPSSEADKAIAEFQAGERKIFQSNEDKMFIPTNKQLFTDGTKDLGEAKEKLESVIGKGLDLDIRTHNAGDIHELAKLPAMQAGFASKQNSSGQHVAGDPPEAGRRKFVAATKS